MWPDMKTFFQNNFQELFRNLILPNIGLNQNMVMLFEEETQCFIDYYFRNAEIQTRRAAAIEVLKVICRHYNQLFEPFLENQISSFDSSEGNIRNECSLLSLIIEGSTKGFRDIDGCTQLFVNERLIQFTYVEIIKKRLFNISEWIRNNAGTPIEKQYQPMYIVTIIRFLFYFRIYFPKNQLSALVKFLTSIKTNLKPLNKVIYLSINGFIVIRHGDFVMYRNLEFFFKGQPLKEIAVDVLTIAYEGTRQSE